MAPPTPPFAADRPSSRPLSEISDNSDQRRSIPRSPKVDKDKSEKPSRPESEVRDCGSGGGGEYASKRMSLSAPLQTLTVNLVDYATMVAKQLPASAGSSSSSLPPAPPSPTTKPHHPEKPEKPPAQSSPSPSIPSATGATLSTPVPEERVGDEDIAVALTQPKASDSSITPDHVAPLLTARRSPLLRPSQLAASYADVAKPALSSGSSTPVAPEIAISASSSIESSRSSTENPSKPPPKLKPSWLRRTSGTSALRTKTKPPVHEEAILTTSSSLPPVLPPRKSAGSSTSDQTKMLPPEVPKKISYANVTAAGSSRSRLGEGQGRPAFSPSPPSHPSRENLSNIRGRIAAWTSNQSNSTSTSQSESFSSISSSPSTFSSAQQRLPTSAQRVFGHAGSAVQKSWAGLRARGVAGSIGSMSGLGQSGNRNLEPSSSWSSGLARGGSRDRTQPAETSVSGIVDGPQFEEGVIKRAGGLRSGRVFGRDLDEAGRAWGVSDLAALAEEKSEFEKRRRACLPALVVRVVEYLELWGPKEEGIFRISGRTSHLSRLRREFDSGADLDLRKCHPADLDPHAVSGIFKSYLRELPTPLLTTALTPKFDAYVKARESVKSAEAKADKEGKEIEDGDVPQDDLPSLVKQLPNAYWFLLADIVKLLDLIPRYTATNRMTLNAVMLSLGPSLNISGGVLSELLERREELFTEPPPLTSLESANTFIDFGEVEIPQPLLSANLDVPPPSRCTTPASLWSAGSAPTLREKKKSPRLPHKPSITRLFSSASGSGLASKQSSVDSLPLSVVDVEPPRVEVPFSTTSPLPSFQRKELPEETEHLQDNDKESSQLSHCPDPEKIPVMPTPIADRFASTSHPFPSLRGPRSSSGSTTMPQSPSLDKSPGGGTIGTPTSSPGQGTSPITQSGSFRRGAPVFFSSTGTTDRHGRSHSANSVSKVTGVIGVKSGKDESPLSSPPPPATAPSSPTATKTPATAVTAISPTSTSSPSTPAISGKRDSKGKRLSSGPSPINVREMARQMECA